jgi:hypothetical protein
MWHAAAAFADCLTLLALQIRVKGYGETRLLRAEASFFPVDPMW